MREKKERLKEERKEIRQERRTDQHAVVLVEGCQEVDALIQRERERERERESESE